MSGVQAGGLHPLTVSQVAEPNLHLSAIGLGVSNRRIPSGSATLP